MTDNLLPTPAAWGPWATAFMGAFIALSFFVTPTIVGALFAGALAATRGSSTFEYATVMENCQGLFVSISTIASALLGGLLIFVAVGMRRYQCAQLTLRHYLRLNRPPGWRPVFMWTGILALYLLAMDASAYLLGRPIVPEFSIKIYQTAVFPHLLWLAMVVAAPFFEEVLFRGFLLEGYLKTRRRTCAAVVVFSAAWAGLHFQYDLFQIAWIFGLGLLLYTARLKTGSLWTPIALHTLCNLAATIETAIVAT